MDANSLSYGISSLIGLVPRLDNQRQVKPSNLLKIVIYILSVCGLIYTVFNLYERTETKEALMNMTDTLIVFIEFPLLYSAFSLVVLNTVSWKLPQWNEYFSCLNLADEELDKNRKFKPGRKCLSFDTFLGLHIITSCLCLLYENYVWVTKIGIGIHKFNIFSSVLRFIVMLISVIYAGFAISMKIRYVKLNQLMRTDCNTIRSIDHYQNLILLDKALLIRIQTIGDTYRLLGKANNAFNSIFGWPILLVFSVYLTALQRYLNSFLLSARFEHTMSSCPLALYILVICAVVTLSCNAATRDGKEFIELCLKLEQEFLIESEVPKELLIFAKSSENFIPRFSAAGFFDIGKGTLLGFIATTTTYFIIVIQFNESLQ